MAADLLYRLVTDADVKLDLGARRRQQNKEAMARGEKPENYRVTWLRGSTQRVVALLQEMAAEFNRLHPHDRCSVVDLLDVLASATGRFEAAIKKAKVRGSG